MEKKRFFVKLLPVEGELQVGDMTFWDDSMGFYAKQFVRVSESFLIHARASQWKKFKYFLCSRDVSSLQVGEEYYEHTQIKPDRYEKFSYTEDDKLEKFIPENSFKVIGEISPEVTFLSDGDELDENDFFGPAYKDAGSRKEYITVRCKCCKKFV